VPRDRIVGALRHFAGVKFEPSVANAAFDQLRPSVAESLCASAEKFMLIRCCLPKKVCRPRGWSSKPSDGRRFVCGHSLSGSGALSKGRAMKPSAHWAMADATLGQIIFVTGSGYTAIGTVAFFVVRRHIEAKDPKIFTAVGSRSSRRYGPKKSHLS
jgi:hypothetical protein